MTQWEVLLEPSSMKWSDNIPNKNDAFKIEFWVVKAKTPAGYYDGNPLIFKATEQIFCDRELLLSETNQKIYPSLSQINEAKLTIRSQDDNTEEEPCLSAWESEGGINGLNFLIIAERDNFSELITNIRSGLYPITFKICINSELLDYYYYEDDIGYGVVWDNIDEDNDKLKITSFAINYQPIERTIEYEEGIVPFITHNSREIIALKDLSKKVDSMKSYIKITNSLLILGIIILVTVLIVFD